MSMSGWTGAGYSVLDPDTGGYLIEGKGNGGFLFFLEMLAGTSIALAFAGIGAAALATFGGGLILLLAF